MIPNDPQAQSHGHAIATDSPQEPAPVYHWYHKMSAVIFIPAVFALGLLFFPKGTEEWMRWWSLLGTAVTLVVSLCLFIDYYKMLDSKLDQGRPNEKTSLLARHDAAVAADFSSDPRKVGVRDSNDQIARVIKTKTCWT